MVHKDKDCNIRLHTAKTFDTQSAYTKTNLQKQLNIPYTQM